VPAVKLFNRVVLTAYMRRLLEQRATVIKREAEADKRQP
jgi:hypothetical protein